jgi:hypothetical protein
MSSKKTKTANKRQIAGQYDKIYGKKLPIEIVVGKRRPEKPVQAASFRGWNYH